ncbi:hypothetical protein BB561_004181 [Smittium simulii]|uniref:Holocytochrome c-type synthase n=1 Tax=Smittium simulii TaxID=133385 RepID=A0A2T9YHM9_9FUNG|nr:hypothetical protein BB561_004181 [Smittium simulii]
MDNQSSSPTCPVSKSEKINSAKCPVKHDKHQDDQHSASNKVSTATIESLEIDPVNNMPNLPQQMHQNQQVPLSTEREISSIPRQINAEVDSHMLKNTDENSNYWEYPSPQQFYNALMRKGQGVEEHHIDTVVQIHNFLNEGAWKEVLKWESLHRECKIHKLISLQGRPDDLSPKARIYGWFGGAKPFDRHDWYVDRCGKKVRYVIDYYEAPSEDGNPAFNLDVRPALDSFESLVSRVKMLFKSDEK